MRLLRLVGATAAAAGLVFAQVVTASAAFAGREAHVDPTHDVRKYTVDDTPGSDPGVVESRAEGDIRVIRVKHGTGRVRVALRFAALNPRGDGHSFYFRVSTPSGGKRFYVSAYPGRWGGVQTLQTGSGGKWSCSGAWHKIDYTYDRVSVVIPRSCLGNPRWVRVGAASVLDDMDYNLHIDDARSTRVGANAVLGPRVYKG